MKKGITVSSKNINSIINSLKKKIKASGSRKNDGMILYLPKSIRGKIDRKKYKGIGRPRLDDYKRIPYPKYLKGMEL